MDRLLRRPVLPIGRQRANAPSIYRQDALTSAAHAVMRHCQRLITSATGQPRADVRAAKQVIRWLELLDLL